LIGLDYVRHFIFPAFLHSWHGFAIIGAVLLLGVVVFSSGVFGLIERMQREIMEQNHRLSTLNAEARRQAQQLRALHEAGRALTAELDLETVLQKVVDLSRELVDARYGALAVLDEGGHFGRFLTSGIDWQTRERIGRPPVGRGVVGVVLEEGRPLRVADISTHRRSVGFPPEHPLMRTFLGVPIVSRNTVIGNLYLTDKHGGEEFTKEDEDAVVMLASQAAIAIENARLYEQEQAIAVLEERERIAQDLHDGIIQSLYAIGLGLEQSLERANRLPEETHERLSRAVEGLNGVIWDVRNYIFGLETRDLQNQSLNQGLVNLAHEFRVNSLVDADVVVSGEVEGVLSPEQTAQIFHITREALSNVVKHAHASSVVVNLRRRNGHLDLSIQDNGIGFDHQDGAGTGHGLRNIAERAKALSGTFSMASVAGQGTRLELEIPLMTSEERSL
jgi:signal transduction histidine kinase